MAANKLFTETCIREYENGNKTYSSNGYITSVHYKIDNEYDIVYFEYKNSEYIIQSIHTHDGLYYEY
jgi:hypothetical protein